MNGIRLSQIGGTPSCVAKQVTNRSGIEQFQVAEPQLE